MLAFLHIITSYTSLHWFTILQIPINISCIFSYFKSHQFLINTPSYTLFTLQGVSPAVTQHLGKRPCTWIAIRRPCESVANRPLPCKFYGSFRLFKISASDFCTTDMRRQFHSCAYEFPTTVTTGVVHGVHKVVIQSSFGVIWRHKGSQDIGP